ncbi:DNA-processing protein DprA [Chamaesiphon sp.]|uniref:DNA-processing protein DprA n=1 Tax=Chamaesiphon sp. TaxID=2814140 RepID=UPI0035942B8D
MSQERIYWLAWSKISGVGAILIDRIYQHFGNLEAAWNADSEKILAIDGVGTQLIATIIATRAKIDPHKLSITHSIDNPDWWTRIDPDYPRLLAEIPSAPGVLYYRGKVVPAENLGNIPTVGIVGTRDPSDYGKRWARKISALLASKGFTIVSGLAQGIDTEAHSACLEAGGRTIAVVGTGLDLVYPPRNQALAADIHQHGLMVSEYPAGTTPDRSHFPARNRIIAGLSRVTIVIEAPTRSGALITAHQANDYGRDVYVLPGSLDNPNSLGCLGLLSRGAQPILGLDHLLELLSSIPQLDPSQQLQLFSFEPERSQVIDGTQIPTTESEQITPPDLSPDLQQVWLLMTTSPTSFDEIVSRCQLPVANVSATLLELELLGLVTQLPGMRYQR